MRKTYLKMIGQVPEPAIIRHFIPSGDYTRTDTSRTVTVSGGHVELQWRVEPEGVGPGLLGLITRVKNELKKREKLITWPTPQEMNVPYACIQEFHGDLAAFELDLSAAYVEAARDLGAVSAKLARRLLQCSKRSRLIALGATATRKTVTTFKSGRQVKSEFKQDPLGKRFFEALGVRVSIVMNKLRRAAGRDFVYYWADAIFVRKGHVVAVLRRAKELGVPIHEPEPVHLEIENALLRVSDGRTFPAQTLSRNPFAEAAPQKLDRKARRVIENQSGKKVELASAEDLKILWDLARSGKKLTAAQGIQLYRSTNTKD